VRFIPIALFLAWIHVGVGPAVAHEVRPAYLEIRETSSDLFDVLWKVPAKGDQRLALHLAWPEDVRHVIPVGASLEDGAYLEWARIQRPGGIPGTLIRVDGLESTITDVLVRVEYLDGSTQVTRLTPDRPSFEVARRPSGMEVARTYLILGVEHIWLGIDHLLFVLSLCILVRGWGRLVKTITAFTLAHSLTLSGASLGFVRVPGGPVEAMISLSIVLVAVEIVRKERGRPGSASRWPWVVSFAFGLLHGFGFAGALHEIGLPQTAIPVALLCFKLGVEAGQILFIGAVMAVSGVAVSAARTLGKPSIPAKWKVVGAYGIGGVAAFWFMERSLALL